jgi:hypothetical protein
VLFAVHTVGVLGVATSSQAGLGPAKVLTLIGWLIGLGAVMACGSARPAPSSPRRRH